MLKEACVENFTNVPEVIERGAKRIELCDNLAVGGTTPSVGVIKIATEYCSDKNVSLIVILRPRGGDFVYSAMEKAIMMRDLEEIIALQANGIAVGALTAATHWINPFWKKSPSWPAIMESSLLSTWHLIKYRKKSKETHYCGWEKLVSHGF
jgi:copper homeostasis protein